MSLPKDYRYRDDEYDGTSLMTVRQVTDDEVYCTWYTDEGEERGRWFQRDNVYKADLN